MSLRNAKLLTFTWKPKVTEMGCLLLVEKLPVFRIINSKTVSGQMTENGYK